MGRMPAMPPLGVASSKVRFGRQADKTEVRKILKANASSGLTEPVLTNFCFVYGDNKVPVRLGGRQLFKIPLGTWNMHLKRDLKTLFRYLQNNQGVKRLYELGHTSIIPHNVHFVFMPGVSDTQRAAAVQKIIGHVKDKLRELGLFSRNYSLFLDFAKTREWREKKTGEHIVQFQFSDLFESLLNAGSGATSDFATIPQVEIQNHLKTLGIEEAPERVTRDFLETTIKPSWKKLVKQHHTDTNQGGPLSKIQEINAAYTALKAEAERNG